MGEFTLFEDSFTCDTSFGEDSRRVDLPRLTGGSANVSFGELTVDMTGCRVIADGCRIDANCSFGELTLIFPKSCRVEPETHTAFASVEFAGQPDPDAKNTVYVNCDASFGEISVRYA